MRIISGSARGRKIDTIPGEDTRPTSDRVKESLFGIIQFDIPEAIVLDLFSGSGGLAFEALSRGASFAYCNDISSECISIIAQNAAKLKFKDKLSVRQMDFRRCIESFSGEKNPSPVSFDFIFLDPPYASALAMQALKLISEHSLLSSNGIIVVERNEKSAWDLEAIENAGLDAYDQRRYGSTTLNFLKQKNS